MKLIRFSMTAVFALCAALLGAGCSDDEGVDNREPDYGYVQFKLYKSASYEAPATPAEAADASSRAAGGRLDYLAEAAKVRVTLAYGETTIAQILTLSAADEASAEFGLRSSKLKLLTGTYRVVTYTLYDALDREIYIGSPAGESSLEVVSGGLTVHDLTVSVEPRGKVRFTLVKDFSDFQDTPRARAANGYTFDEIKYIDLTVVQELSGGLSGARTSFSNLPCTFSIHFDEENEANGTPGYQTATSLCDTLLSLPAGSYRVLNYTTKRSTSSTLEVCGTPPATRFTVADNRTTEADVKVRLYESDDYIKDYYALYEIWKALGGEKWYYDGESFPRGANWDFNRDPDLWGAQPGVALHDNGRVARIDLSDFGFSGALPDAIGQLTELTELYLGSHNDVISGFVDPTLDPAASVVDRLRNRMENHKRLLTLLYPPTQVSAPIAQALRIKGIRIPAASLYDRFTEEEIITRADEILDPRTGEQRIRPMDTTHGKICNGLTAISEEIGKLKKLVFFNVANSTIGELPDAMRELESCTDLEVYNCPNMKRFPMVLAEMPALISVNISNNLQWEADDLYRGIEALAEGPSKEKIQILYCNNNRLETLPPSFRNFTKLGLLDLAYNRLSSLPALGKGVSLVKVMLDHNLLTEIPHDEEGYFCGYNDMETFSCTYNKLKKVPDIFSAKSLYGMESVDFSFNDIDGFEGEEDGSYRGIYVETFTLAGNPKLTKFPACLSESSSPVGYLILRGCGLTEFPKGALDGKYTSSLRSIDLSYNHLTELPNDFNAEALPYLYGVDLSYNAFTSVPFGPLNSASLTVYAIRGQRDAEGNRCLRTWPANLYQHTGLRGFYIGSNDLRTINETISYMIYNLDISDNPNIIFDASDICAWWKAGVYKLFYDKTQTIVNCDAMLE